MNFLKKIQNLSEKKRKIILWSVIVVIGMTLLFFWFKELQQKIASFEGEKFLEGIGLPALKEELDREKGTLEGTGIEEGLRELEGAIEEESMEK